MVVNYTESIRTGQKYKISTPEQNVNRKKRKGHTASQCTELEVKLTAIKKIENFCKVQRDAVIWIFTENTVLQIRD